MAGRTQDLMTDHVCRWYRRVGPMVLIYQALLHRGFLVRRTDGRVFFAEGSHPLDLVAVGGIRGLIVHANGELLLSPGVMPRAVAHAILRLPEHHDRLGNSGGFTSTGPTGHVGTDWSTFANTAYGAKLPVTVHGCPGPARAHGSLDIGVSLFVKALPAGPRIITELSCDGHGVPSRENPGRIAAAWVRFRVGYDLLWHEAVHKAMAVPTPASRWSWVGGCVRIEALEGDSDEAVLGMLLDIHRVALSYLDDQVIQQLGASRRRVVARFCAAAPKAHAFVAAAKQELTAGGVGRARSAGRDSPWSDKVEEG
jgi:hypothetical protein